MFHLVSSPYPLGKKRKKIYFPMAALSWQINKHVFLAINGQDLETFGRAQRQDKLTAFWIRCPCKAMGSANAEWAPVCGCEHTPGWRSLWVHCIRLYTQGFHTDPYWKKDCLSIHGCIYASHVFLSSTVYFGWQLSCNTDIRKYNVSLLCRTGGNARHHTREAASVT